MHASKLDEHMQGMPCDTQHIAIAASMQDAFPAWPAWIAGPATAVLYMAVQHMCCSYTRLEVSIISIIITPSLKLQLLQQPHCQGQAQPQVHTVGGVLHMAVALRREACQPGVAVPDLPQAWNAEAA